MEDVIYYIQDKEQENNTKEGKDMTREWISVSEEQPKEKYYCLCCDEEGYITIGYFSVLSKEWCFVDSEIDIDVIAWMPLPEPYKENN